MIETAAVNSGRSMNAEIVHRLEGSFDEAPNPGELLSAEEAKKKMKQAQEGMKGTILALTIDAINKSIIKGQSEIELNFSAVAGNPETVGEDSFFSMVSPALNALEDKGYNVEDIGEGHFIVRI